MGQNVAQGSEGVPTVPIMETAVGCILAVIGFACLTAWGTYVVFVPTLPLLSSMEPGAAVACLLVSRLTANAALVFCYRKADFVFDRIRSLVFPGALALYLPAVIVAVFSLTNIVPPDSPFFYLAWILVGVGELSLSLAWTVLFSMISAKWIALTIAVGGALATPLFLLIAGAENPFIGLGGIAFAIAVSGTTAFYLLSKTGNPALQAMRSFQRHRTVTAKSALSVGSHGLVYGFVTIMLCSLGKQSVLVAAGAGIVGAGVAFVWALRRTKTKWDTGMVQRTTIPIVVAVLLFLPFFDSVGRTVCGAVAIATFAYATLMEWTELAVTNSEFQLFPVVRYACSRLAQWIGFLVGAAVAFAAFYVHPLEGNQLVLLSCVVTVAIVAIFAIYGADDSGSKEALSHMMTAAAKDLEIDPPKNAAPFRDRCDAIAKRYQLSAREAEVFVCLAKGRNVEYIQQKLFISSNTVKTHIYHIYKKIGINSQQRLIDLVDGAGGSRSGPTYNADTGQAESLAPCRDGGEGAIGRDG